MAYSYAVVAKTTVYGEVLPGYSIISWSGPTAKGFVLAFGAGVALDLSDRLFANLGVGYQAGKQMWNNDYDFTTRFLRIAIGTGMKL